jgi:hypothetical protein
MVYFSNFQLFNVFFFVFCMARSERMVITSQGVGNGTAADLLDGTGFWMHIPGFSRSIGGVLILYSIGPHQVGL